MKSSDELREEAAARQARKRERGETLSVILRDSAAVYALADLIVLHGSKTAAVSEALKFAARYQVKQPGVLPGQQALPGLD